MKGFTQRQGWHFKGVFLLVVLLDHKNVGDELAVSPWCPWANSQSCSVPWWRIQTRCAIKHAEGPINMTGWRTVSASTETRDNYLLKELQQRASVEDTVTTVVRPSNNRSTTFFSLLFFAFFSFLRNPDWVLSCKCKIPWDSGNIWDLMCIFFFPFVPFWAQS